jgi:hypothetical protein
MEDKSDKITPAGFDRITPADPSLSAGFPQQMEAPGANKWVPPVLTALIVVAAVVFFWLPGAVDKPVIELKDTQPGSQPGVATSSGKPERSPWQEAQTAKVRKEAQEVLGKLLDLQFELEEQGAPEWAAKSFTTAQEQAVVADKLYRGQDFAAARDAYSDALATMQVIADSANTLFEDAMSRGRVALNTLIATDARKAFSLALKIKPDNIEAHNAAGRAANIEKLLALVQQAEVLTQRGKLTDARELLLQAKALDPAYTGANSQLALIDEELTNQRFNTAMSAGYDALHNGNFTTAENQFKAAAKLRPDASEVQTALRETRDTRSLQKIGAARTSAETAESSEQWQRALNTYEALLKSDNTLVFARIGTIRSGARARLDKGLRDAIASPQRLADPGALAQARVLYKDARTIATQGPVLEQQIAALATILEDAVKPRMVELRSDQLTDVTLRKVAALGTFTSQRLSLKPGTYVAVGSRSGYRDVRREFTVAGGSSSEAIVIQCTEPI